MKTFAIRWCVLVVLLSCAGGCGESPDEPEPSLNSPTPGNPKAKLDARGKGGRGGPGSLGGPTD